MEGKYWEEGTANDYYMAEDLFVYESHLVPRVSLQSVGEKRDPRTEVVKVFG